MPANKYTLQLTLNVLKHLGFNLYSNIPSVLSEVVANAYDADATLVKINFNPTDQTIEILDDGHGMSLTDINNKFLAVGYQRRENGEGLSKKFKRPVMGRKGIGKLSLFSIAHTIQVYSIKGKGKTKELNGFELNRTEIEKDIKAERIHHPKDLDTNQVKISKGTLIIISDFKKSFSFRPEYLKRRIARRFSVLGADFKVEVDDNAVSYKDRDYLKKVLFIWLVGDYQKEITQKFKYVKKTKVSGYIISEDETYKISGWIGAVSKPSELSEDNYNNNKISIIIRGKMAQEDILETYSEGGIYADYLIGEIHADFLDFDEEDDIATSSRQRINEDDDRYKALVEYVYKILKQIQSEWTDLRNDYNSEKAIEKAEAISPNLIKWFDSLKTDKRKSYAKKLFGTIESLHFDSGEIHKKKELYKQGILAFEKLKLRESLNELQNLKSEDDFRLAGIFSDLNDIEANLFYDIASERVEVIKKFQNHMDENDKEKVLQDYLFDNLWLLNPSWERPTAGTKIMEQRVEKEFGKVTKTLTQEESKGRLDIKYRTAGGKHIIVELKRYKPSYKITHTGLYAQVDKYREALKKCLIANGEENPFIEGIVVLGEQFDPSTFSKAVDILRTINSRIIYYDTLINESLKSYSEYLNRQNKVSEIRKLIDEM